MTFWQSSEPWNISQITISGEYTTTFDQVIQTETNGEGTYDQVFYIPNFIGTYDQVLHIPSNIGNFDQVLQLKVKQEEDDRVETIRSFRFPEPIRADSACTHDNRHLFVVNSNELNTFSNLYCIETYEFKQLYKTKLEKVAVGITYDDQNKYIAYKNESKIYKLDTLTGIHLPFEFMDYIDISVYDNTSAFQGFGTKSGITYNPVNNSLILIDKLGQVFELFFNDQATSELDYCQLEIKTGLSLSTYGGIEYDENSILVCNNILKNISRYSTTNFEFLESFLVPFDGFNISDIGFSGYYAYTIHAGLEEVFECDIIKDPGIIQTELSVNNPRAFKQNIIELNHNVYDINFGTIVGMNTFDYTVREYNFLELLRQFPGNFLYQQVNSTSVINLPDTSLQCVYVDQLKPYIALDPIHTKISKFHTMFDNLQSDNYFEVLKSGVLIEPGQAIEIKLEQETVLEGIKLILEVNDVFSFDTQPEQKVIVDYTFNNREYVELFNRKFSVDLNETIANFLDTSAQNLQLLNIRIRSAAENTRTILIKQFRMYQRDFNNVFESSGQITGYDGEVQFNYQIPELKYSRNLIPNPGFYRGFDKWQFSGSNTTSSIYIRKQTSPFDISDKWVVRLESNQTSGVSLTSALIPVIESEKYTFSAYIQGISFNTDDCRVVIQWRRENGLIISESESLEIRNIRQRSISVVECPKYAKFCTISCQLDSQITIIEVSNFQLHLGEDTQVEWVDFDSRYQNIKTVVEF